MSSEIPKWIRNSFCERRSKRESSIRKTATRGLLVLGLLMYLSEAVPSPEPEGAPQKPPSSPTSIVQQKDRSTELKEDTMMSAWPAIEACKKDMAERTGVDPGEIEVVQVTPAQWPAADLGCPKEGEVVAQVVTNGWVIILTGETKELYPTLFVYHTDGRIQTQDGEWRSTPPTDVRLCSTAPFPTDEEKPPFSPPPPVP